MGPPPSPKGSVTVIPPSPPSLTRNTPFSLHNQEMREKRRERAGDRAADRLAKREAEKMAEKWMERTGEKGAEKNGERKKEEEKEKKEEGEREQPEDPAAMDGEEEEEEERGGKRAKSHSLKGRSEIKVKSRPTSSLTVSDGRKRFTQPNRNSPSSIPHSSSLSPENPLLFSPPLSTFFPPRSPSMNQLASPTDSPVTTNSPSPSPSP
eukprot:CAMPEP_0201506024 /NCGR_PEP_ID=MMETSP0151_2-20130828/86118_1 /ASSEMBLY_ACC=CAM_ASM_000257 /TAXON_ID=200890 /ORGANISM="Paramoeba atlantica, Strain 621/1 / CCAP 1560/9" /LENGTH=207 /DNA_ID=CAMNT_0047899997 /DNA_START=60 /DNA_END=679 /DNA_ORIENTATION=+